MWNFLIRLSGFFGRELVLAGKKFGTSFFTAIEKSLKSFGFKGKSVEDAVRFVNGLPISQRQKALQSLAGQIALAIGVDAAVDLISNLAKDEQEATGSVSATNALIDLVRSMPNVATPDEIAEIFNGKMEDLDGESGVSASDVIIANKRIEDARRYSALEQASNFAQAAALVDGRREELTRLSNLLGISPKRCVELALLLRKVDESYEVLV